MKHIVSDCLNVGSGLCLLVRGALDKDNLSNLVQLSRPNWHPASQAGACRYLSQRSLRRVSEFAHYMDYLAYLDKQLQDYSRQHPVRQELAVADELALARWQARWARVRQRRTSSMVSSRHAASNEPTQLRRSA